MPADETALDEPLRSVLEPKLEEGERVWAVVQGRDGSSLVGTDRRLMLVRGDRSPSAASVDAWPHAMLDDLLVIPGGLLVRRRTDHKHIATVPLPREPAEETLQAVTVIALLLAVANRGDRLPR